MRCFLFPYRQKGKGSGMIPIESTSQLSQGKGLSPSLANTRLIQLMSKYQEPITLCLLPLAKARTPSPPQASIGTITLSTSPATMQSSEKLFPLTKYCGAVLSPASTHGKNVNPICPKIDRRKQKYYENDKWKKRLENASVLSQQFYTPSWFSYLPLTHFNAQQKIFLQHVS